MPVGGGVPEGALSLNYAQTRRQDREESATPHLLDHSAINGSGGCGAVPVGAVDGVIVPLGVGAQREAGEGAAHHGSSMPRALLVRGGEAPGRCVRRGSPSRGIYRFRNGQVGELPVDAVGSAAIGAVRVPAAAVLPLERPVRLRPSGAPCPAGGPVGERRTARTAAPTAVGDCISHHV